MIPGNPVVGGTVLRRAAIQSPNYVAGSTGWSINADGSAEFNNITVRGTFMGPNFDITADGIFFYSPSKAFNNLIVASTAAIVTDAYGNTVPNPGVTTFVNALPTGFAALNDNGGALNWSYAASEAGPWTVAGEVGINITIDPTDLIINFASWTHPP